MKYNPAGEIVKVMVSLVLGFVREAVLILDQEFQITFVQVVCEEYILYLSWSAHNYYLK